MQLPRLWLAERGCEGIVSHHVRRMSHARVVWLLCKSIPCVAYADVVLDFTWRVIEPLASGGSICVHRVCCCAATRCEGLTLWGFMTRVQPGGPTHVCQRSETAEVLQGVNLHWHQGRIVSVMWWHE